MINISLVFICIFDNPAKSLVVQKEEAKNNDISIFVKLTNRLLVAVCLFSNKSKMTSKFNNEKVAFKPLGKSVTDVRTTL